MKDGTRRRLWPKSQTEKFWENNNKKKKKKNELFFPSPSPYQPPGVFCKGIKVKILFFFFDRGVALTSASGHRGTCEGGSDVPACKCGFFCLCVCVKDCREGEAWTGVGWGAGGGAMRNRCFPSVCLHLALEMKASGGGGVGCRCLNLPTECLPAQWRDRCGPVMGERGGPGGPSRLSKRQKAAWCQLGWSKQTYASLREKTPD